MTKCDEFSRGWPTLLAAMFGSAVGISGLLAYNLGLFVKDLTGAIGLSRTHFGTSVLLATFGMAMMMPIVGWLVDRLSGRTAAAGSAVLLSLTFVAMGTMMHSVPVFLALVALLGVLGSATTPVSFTRAVTTWFEEARGLALALIMTGIGVSSVSVPRITAAVIETWGWQSGFLLLAAISALSIPVTLWLLRSRDEQGSKAPARVTNARFTAIRRRGLFWLQATAFATMALTFFGMMVHLVPMLRDQGLTSRAAAGYVSLLGGSIICSRVLVGWLADMVHAPWLAMASCASGGLACAAMASGYPSCLPFVSIAVGVAVGAETDLLGYLTARYFGLQVYGRVYAWQYGLFIVAAGSSPAWVGFVRDRTGSYSAGLLISAGLSLVAMFIFFLLPPYRETRSQQAEPEPT